MPQRRRPAHIRRQASRRPFPPFHLGTEVFEGEAGTLRGEEREKEVAHGLRHERVIAPYRNARARSRIARRRAAFPHKPKITSAVYNTIFTTKTSSSLR
jgi:hypothetical protein